MLRRLGLPALALPLAVFAADPAYAYLDPGTGSIILQALLGGVAGGLMVLKLFWGNVKSYFSGRSSTAPERQVPSTSSRTNDVSKTRPEK